MQPKTMSAVSNCYKILKFEELIYLCLIRHILGGTGSYIVSWWTWSRNQKI